MAPDTLPAGTRVLCPCGCGKLVSPKTAQRHRHGQLPMLLRIGAVKTKLQGASLSRKSFASLATALASPVRSALTTYGQKFARRHRQDADVVPSVDLPTSAQTAIITNHECGEDDVLMNIPVGNTESESLAVADAALLSAQRTIWSGRTRAATTEDVADDEDSVEAEDSDTLSEPAKVLSTAEDSEDELRYEPIHEWDRIREHWDQVMGGFHLALTDDDLVYIRPFVLKVECDMPAHTFARLPYVFPNASVPSWKACQQRAANLSGFSPQVYDCCINSCCCFVGVHANSTDCVYCKSSRYDENGKRRQEFVYLPIIPRLKALFANAELSLKLRYRSSEHQHAADTIKDIFDSSLYRSLLGKKVIVDGKELNHTYFQDATDVAVGVSTDGFPPFRHRSKTCWPLILFLYNLPPEIRFHLENILSLGVVPGPKKPIDFDSFLWPLIQELLQLAVGIHAYDAATERYFALRAYLLLVFGDIPAISMVMRMKGHNGFCPCRMCEIHGVRCPDTHQPTHYVPLDRSQHPDIVASASSIKVYDPGNLPLRTHDRFMQQAHEVQFARTEVEANALSRTYGIKGISALSALSSLSFPHSFPYDFMHLIWENMMKNMVLLWSGAYKGLDAGSGDYILPAAVWEEIGRIGAESGATIPSCFGPRPPNIASDKSSWTADSRSFWTLFVAPIVLKDRFTDRRYYDHFVAFAHLVETCLQFEMPVSDVATIRAGFIDWVKTYEELYYQHAPSRISTCPLTVHALLHIADSILTTGPVWASWAFPMERYCGSLQPAFKSRRFPFSALNRYVLDRARLSHIRMLYASTIGDPDKLLLRAPALEGYFGGLCIRHYENCALLPSHHIRNFGQGIINKIVGALCTRWSAPPAAVRDALSCTIQEWERFRFLPEGDIVSAAAYHSHIDAAAVVSPKSRDNTFVRYEQIIDLNARFRNLPSRWAQRPFFGQLMHLIVVDTAAIPSPFNIPPTTVLFAIIRACNITSKHATLDIHYYSDVGPLEVVDMTTVQCIVGRVRDRGKWGIVDRSGHLNRVVYIEEE